MKIYKYALLLNLIISIPSFAMDSIPEIKGQNPYCGYISIDFVNGDESHAILSGSCSAIGTINSDKGKRAILLSAAHNFEDAINGAPLIGTVSFATDPNSSNEKPLNIETVYYPKAYFKKNALDKTDICLAVTTMLPNEMEIETADILQGRHFAYDELFEATIVGYGNMHGSLVTEKTEFFGIRRSCKTYTALKNMGRGDSLYETLLKSSVTFKTFMQTTDTNVESFEDTSNREIKVGRDLIVKCHREQLMPSEGCSGGPLVIETINGPRILGVFSKNDVHDSAKAEGMPTVSINAVAIQTNPWIIEVLNVLKEGSEFEGNEEIGKFSMKINS